MTDGGSCSVAAAILDELIPTGTGLVFGIPGGAVSPLFDACIDRPGVRLIITKHETQSAFMAMGYAHATGRPGIVLTTAGPGMTNSLTGLASAFADGVPIVVVSGEVPKTSFGKGAVQEGSFCGADLVGMARRITKFALQVFVPAMAGAVARKAVSTALSGRRGPAFISLPLDVAMAKTHRVPIHGGVATSFVVAQEPCQEAVTRLTNARRPLLLVGSGARQGRGRAAVRALAERLELPVIVTTKAKGVFPEDHPLYVGVFGLGGHETVTNYLKERGPDVLLVCGSSMNDFATNAWSPLLAPLEYQIQVDIDALQIGKNYRTDLGLLGPLDVVLPRMVEMAERPAPRKAVPRLRDMPLCAAPGRNGRLSAQQVMLAINHTRRPGAVIACDVGEFLAPAINLLRVQEGGDFLVGLGFGSMGASIGTAIGYKLAAPGKDVLALCGDGSFLMFGNELATAVQQNVAITVCVINDGRLNMCHHGHNNVYGRAPGFCHDVVDVASAARALGADASRVETEDQLAQALSSTTTKPHVIDIRIDPDVVLGGSQRNAALRHFTEGDAS